MKWRLACLVFFVPLAAGAQDAGRPPASLPVTAVNALTASLKAAQSHKMHVWRDTPPTNSDGTVNAYIEIARGDRRKWEFDMRANQRAIDRMIPESIGGYPVNYGFVPQTVSYDGDPFDALVLGPALPDGQFVRGIAVGVMFMEDEKGLDSKVVLSLVDAAGRPMHQLTEADPGRNRRLLPALQTRSRHVLQSTWMGIGRTGSRVRHDHSQVLSAVRRTFGRRLHDHAVATSSSPSSSRGTRAPCTDLACTAGRPRRSHRIR